MIIGKSVALALLSVLGSLHAVEGHRLHLDNFAPNVVPRFMSALQGLHQRIHPHSKRPYLGKRSRSSDSSEKPFKYLTDVSSKDPMAIAVEYVHQTLSISEKDYAISSSYKSSHNNVTHVYLKQIVNGIEVENGDLNINIDRQGRVVSMGESFFKGGRIIDEPIANNPEDGESSSSSSSSQFALATPQPIDAIEAVAILARFLKQPVPDTEHLAVETFNSLGAEPQTMVLGFSFTVQNGIPVREKYLQVIPEDGSATYLERVWDIQCEMEENWYHAHVSASNGKILGLVDWVSDATYNVYPIGVNDPTDGERKLVKDPADKDASPLGWHAMSEKENYTSTMGNNVYAHENLDGKSNNDYLKNFRPDGGKKLKFDFPLDLKKEPKSYLKAAITNLFYWNNIMHDLFYKYGFDEKSGNFQQNNFGRGGRGNDAVIANAQDGAGYNNANFATPPDGQNGKMRMYVWSQSKPHRDGDLESGIIIHEYAHGISTRLTGGPANSGCLPFGESGGMGEGYGDFFATVIRMRANYTRDMDFGMGTYSMGGKKQGIRKYLYSTNMEVNPSTYSFTKKFAYIGVHAKGEVWAATLYEMYWNLVDKHGFSDNLFDSKASKEDGLPAGNVIALQLVVDSMKLQPCRPSFVDARDAILQADQVNYDGRNTCEIWKAFAKRGLGGKASSGGNEDFSVPEECQ